MKNMDKSSLFFVSSTDLSNTKAQSVQIPRMAAALAKSAYRFCLIGFSYSGKVQSQDFKQQIFPKKYPKPIRNFKVIKAVHTQPEKHYSIFTRDLFFAIYFTLIGKPTLWECHQHLNKKTLFWVRILARFANFYTLSISKKLAEQVPVRPSNNFVYHSAAQLPEHYNSQQQPTFKPNTALYTGALHKGKDIESLIPLFNHRPDWHFVIAGGRPKEIEKYRQLFATYNNVEVIGRIDPALVHSYQKAADLLLYPLTKSSLYWEVTSPLKLFEYMSAGVPILASRIGSVAEIINEENAFIYNEEEGILTAFDQYIATDKNKIEAMTRKNLALIHDTYNWDARADFIVSNILTGTRR